MQSRSTGGAWIVVVLVLLPIMGCRGSGSEIHLIPAGYVGPVVIVFDSPNGETITHREGEAAVYQIPPDGVLHLSTPKPKPGWYEIRYFYVRPDGSRQKIPYHADEGTLQVFADVDGATAKRKDGKSAKWRSYVVGVPGELDNWGVLRDRAEEAAIGKPGLQ